MLMPLPELLNYFVKKLTSTTMVDSDSSTASEFLPSPTSAAGNSASSVEEEVAVVPAAELVLGSLQHPVTVATMNDFDGEVFKINGVTFLLKDIKVDDLRKFCVKNCVKTTLPPHKSVRTATKKVVVDEIKLKKGRLLNNEPDPWEIEKEKNRARKPVWVNRYRLANVVFGEECREAVSNRGKTLTREELDLGLKTDQRTIEKVAMEYNRQDVDLIRRGICETYQRLFCETLHQAIVDHRPQQCSHRLL